MLFNVKFTTFAVIGNIPKALVPSTGFMFYSALYIRHQQMQNLDHISLNFSKEIPFE